MGGCLLVWWGYGRGKGHAERDLPSILKTRQ